MTVGRIPSVEGGIQPTLLTAKGDLISATAASTVARLAVGTNDQILVADSSTATGLKWATPASSTPTFVGCSLTKSAAQSIADNTNTLVSFDVEGIDTDGFHDNSTNNERITIPSGKSGKYLITAQLIWANNATSYRQLFLFKNTTQVSLSFIASPANGPTLNIAYVVSATAGDYFLLKAYQNTGGAVNVQSDAFSTGASYFTATFLGA